MTAQYLPAPRLIPPVSPAAGQLLAYLRGTLADLQAEPGPSLPTLAEYLFQIIAAAGPGFRHDEDQPLPGR